MNSKVRGPKRSPALLAGAVAASILACWVLVEGSTIIAADWRSSQARLDVARWMHGRQPWDLKRWQAVEADLQAALRLMPNDPTLIESTAMLYTVRGQHEWGDGAADSPGVAMYRQALELQRRALEIRPLQGSSWANLALIHYAADDSFEEVFDAWRKGLKYGPNEAHVQQVLMSVGKLTWQYAPDDIKAWMEQREPGVLKRLEAAETAAGLAPTSPASASASPKP